MGSLTSENDLDCENHDDGNKSYVFTFLNTNARSLSPKIHSLIDCIEEMEAAFAVITETWLSDGEGLAEDIEGLELGAGLGMLALNRDRNHRGVS